MIPRPVFLFYFMALDGALISVLPEFLAQAIIKALTPKSCHKVSGWPQMGELK